MQSGTGNRESHELRCAGVQKPTNDQLPPCALPIPHSPFPIHGCRASVLSMSLLMRATKRPLPAGKSVGSGHWRVWPGST